MNIWADSWGKCVLICVTVTVVMLCCHSCWPMALTTLLHRAHICPCWPAPPPMPIPSLPPLPLPQPLPPSDWKNLSLSHRADGMPKYVEHGPAMAFVWRLTHHCKERTLWCWSLVIRLCNTHTLEAYKNDFPPKIGWQYVFPVNYVLIDHMVKCLPQHSFSSW